MIALSANHYICPDGYGCARFLDEAARAGYRSVALTRAALAEMSPTRLRKELDLRDLRVTSLNSAGFFTWRDPERRASQEDENRALVDAAAEIGAGTLCVITGGSLEQQDIASARARIVEGLGVLDACAANCGVRLGLEPIHPRDAPTKGCVNSIAQAREFIRPLTATGLILDLFHSWWDPDLVPTTGLGSTEIVQICNVTPEPRRSPDLANGMLDVRVLVQDMRANGFEGPLEFEIFAADHGQAGVAPILEAAMDWARG